MKKEKRDLDGFYLRVKRGKKWENLCFTDLATEEQQEWLNKLSAEGLRRMVRSFCENIFAMSQLGLTDEELRIMVTYTADVLRKCGDSFGIVKQTEE